MRQEQTMLEMKPSVQVSGLVITGRILEPDTQPGRWRVVLDGQTGPESARVALTGSPALGLGQEVLLARSTGGELFVIALVGTNQPAPRLVLDNGAAAEIVSTTEGEQLRVLSPSGELVFAYDAATNKTRVRIPQGDLAIDTPEGAVAINARDGVTMQSDRTISMTSAESVELRAAQAPGVTGSEVLLRKGQALLHSQTLMLLGEKAAVRFGQLDYVGERMRAKIADAGASIETLSVAAETVTRKARRVYETVEELLQTKAGRLRTVVEGTYHLKSRLLMLKAETDAKIKGEQIYLG